MRPVIKSSMRRGVRVCTITAASGPQTRMQRIKLKSNKAAEDRQLLASAAMSP